MCVCNRGLICKIIFCAEIRSFYAPQFKIKNNTILSEVYVHVPPFNNTTWIVNDVCHKSKVVYGDPKELAQSEILQQVNSTVSSAGI